jgi:MFS transporter, FHS family, L-fucose permease
MATEKINISKISPVLMAFFVMSFCDLVGICVDRIKPVFQLTDTKAQLITSVVFVWFFLLSVPIGIIQSKIGKRNMLNIGIGVTALGLFIPFFFNSFEIMLIGFALIGIGNTIVQGSANPLLIDVVPGSRASSFLSFSQFVKAIGSMIAAPLAGILASQFGNWKLLLAVFGVISILTAIWLSSTKIEESKQEGPKVTFSTSFGLLKIKFVLLMIISIFLVVGIDVGFNSNSGQFLMKQFGIEPVAAENGRTVYFIGRIIGTFAGAIMLTRISSRKFFVWTASLGLICLVAILLVKSSIVAWGLTFLIGLAVANIWPLIFSIVIEKNPLKRFEISGLVMMAISGGAVIPLLVGWVSDISGIALGMAILVACMIYLWAVSVYCLKK